MIDTLLQNGAELIRGCPDWVFAVLAVALVFIIPITAAFGFGGDK